MDGLHSNGQAVVSASPAHPSDAQWPRTIRSGAGLVFWFLLLPPLLTNLVAFMLPFIGGSSAHLKWVGLIYTFGGFPLLVGIMKLTAAPTLGVSKRTFDYTRQVFRVFASADVIARVVKSLLTFASGPGDSLYVVLPLMLLDVAWVVSATVYLTGLCQHFGTRKLVHEMSVAAFGYVVLTILIWGLDPTGEKPRAMALGLVSLFVLSVGMGTWAVSIVWRFRRIVGRICVGRCVDCGYILKGLPGRVCPECGRAFVSPADIR